MSSFTPICLRIFYKGGRNTFWLYRWADVLEVLATNRGGWRVFIRRPKDSHITVDING